MEQEPELGWTEVLGEEVSNPETRPGGDTVLAFDEEWTVCLFENRLAAQFENWVRKGAKRAIQEADMENSEEAALLRSAYMADLGAGKYNWDGRHCRMARSDLPGLKYLFFLVLRRNHPKITEERASQIYAFNPADSVGALNWSMGNWDRLRRGLPPLTEATEQITREEKGNSPKTKIKGDTVTVNGEEIPRSVLEEAKARLEKLARQDDMKRAANDPVLQSQIKKTIATMDQEG